MTSLEPSHTSGNPEGFTRFIRTQLSRYFRWQEIAEEGFSYIPKRYLIPVKTASEMYKWTARVIHRDPFIVYERKVKPSVTRIVGTIGYNTLFA